MSAEELKGKGTQAFKEGKNMEAASYWRKVGGASAPWVTLCARRRMRPTAKRTCAWRV